MNTAEIKQWLTETEGKGGIARRDHVEWLVSEIEASAEIYRRQLKDQEELYELRRAVFRIGNRLENDILDKAECAAVGEELIGESNLCRSCEGDGQDGDEDGGTYACESCRGTGFQRSGAYSREMDEGPTVQCPTY